MKIKTKIWHVTANNGLTYEDFCGYSATVQGKNAEEALTNGRKAISKDDPKAVEFEVKCIFDDVEVEVPTPEPFTTEINGTEFHYNFSNSKLFITADAGDNCVCVENIPALRKYINELMVRIDSL